MAKLTKSPGDYIHNLLGLLGGFENSGSMHTICLRGQFQGPKLGGWVPIQSTERDGAFLTGNSKSLFETEYFLKH